MAKAFAIALTAASGAAVAAPAADSEARVGRVAHVVDGETVDILMNQRRVRLRLAGIEAPLQAKWHALRSRQSLVQLCGGELAVVELRGSDKNGRRLAHVACAGLDASAEQVRRGMASTSREAGLALQKIESEARAARRGMWSTPVSTATGAN